jgi:hypothetical protein
VTLPAKKPTHIAKIANIRKKTRKSQNDGFAWRNPCQDRCTASSRVQFCRALCLHGPSYEHDWLALYVYVHGSGLNNSFRRLGGSLMVAGKWFKTLKLPEKPEKRKLLKISRICMLHDIYI